MLVVLGVACTGKEPPPSVPDAGLLRDTQASLDAGVRSDVHSEIDAGDLPSSTCGDGVVQPGEHCDDGNSSEADDCANDCTPAAPFHDFDALILDLLNTWDVPGATVAVTHDQRLVLRRAYGLADREAQRPMKRTDRMRIASLAKAVTSVAVLRLVEEQRLALDDLAFTILGDPDPPAGQTKDPRLASITVAHLLRHEGGWDRDVSGDPMFKSRIISQALGIPGPATAQDTLSYMLGQPLDFDPGTNYAYSNFGYSVLGRIIEQVTGQSYEDYVRSDVLAPMGITRMELGRTKRGDRPDDEVRYHLYEGARDVVSVFPQDTERVPRPNGGWHQEAMDAHGGWIASATDLVRFVTAVDGRSGFADLLTPASIVQMTQRPELSRWRTRSVYYGMGWSVRPTEGDANWWHMGALPGTATLFLRSWHGFNWVILTNGRPSDSSGFFSALDQAMWSAQQSVTAWPEYDLFRP
jgi:cysteine-rich repeat protein